MDASNQQNWLVLQLISASSDMERDAWATYQEESVSSHHAAYDFGLYPNRVRAFERLLNQQLVQLLHLVESHQVSQVLVALAMVSHSLQEFRHHLSEGCNWGLQKRLAIFEVKEFAMV